MYRAYKICNRLTLTVVRYLLKERSDFAPTSSRLAFNTIEMYEVLEGPSELVVVNTLARDFTSLVTVAVKNNLTLQVRDLHCHVI